MSKRQLGQYYTIRNPFNLKPFATWAAQIPLSEQKIIEPFAGANHIIDLLGDKISAYDSFDIAPNHPSVQQQNTLENFPTGYEVCITNPPWLYKSSAKRRGLPFPHTHYDNLYKHCMDLCLKNCPYVGVLVPASYLVADLFTDRLHTVIVIHDRLFTDTENPVCLALFNPEQPQQQIDTQVYHDEAHIGSLRALRSKLPQSKGDNPDLTFNDPQGQLGLIGIDNNAEASIRFCAGNELDRYPIRHSSRSITRISGVRASKAVLKRLNGYLGAFREETHDVFLTPFKGLRKDGKYRRRLDFRLAKGIIGACV